MLNLGNPDAREWITQIIIGYLKSEKIDHYRQDFNMNPLPFWTENDAPDRIGVHEMRHIEGLYLFWDALRREFPDLFIDNCASGGRRLDFILADYGYPLCQSDYATFGAYRSTCMQLENYFLDDVYPLHVGQSWLPEGDLYAALSCTGTGIGSKVWQFNGRFPDSGHDFNLHRKTLSLIARIRDYKIAGDYYPLTQHAEELENWCAYQVHLPETGEGCVVYFRRRESPAATQLLRLHRIVPERTYRLEFSDGRNREFSGDALAGLTVELAEPRSVGIIFYRMKRDAK
ncbi:hypothetical protein SDC9_124564 [bioreactor metagenome]|uniref:Alpha-galactosidase n=1 Tax=bioreactor metagenome TaxID=1076179 RepID=A0A645CKY1_9ZZZZ